MSFPPKLVLPKRPLITGANGFLGAALARRLSQAGVGVRCLVRPGSDSSALRGLESSIVQGDVNRPDSLAPALAGVDVVFHLAGIRRATTREEFMHTNVEGTRNVAEAMLLAKAKRLVLCGSFAASGPAPKDKPKTEAEPFAPAEWYGESKALAESVAFSFRDRLEVTSIRPTRILGPFDKENLPFFRLARKGVVLKLLGAPRELSLVDVEDVVTQMLIQAHASEAVGEAFFCASAETMTIEAMMRRIAQLYGVKAKVIPLAPFALTALARAADVVSNTTKRRLPLNAKLARQLLAPGWCCSVDKAKRVLRFEAAVRIEDSLRQSAQSYVDAKLMEG